MDRQLLDSLVIGRHAAQIQTIYNMMDSRGVHVYSLILIFS